MNILEGKKTYIVAISAVVYAIAAHVAGQMPLHDVIQYIFFGAGAAAIRKAIGH
jgi:hypothetical protein|tara:strand:- start:167 stop:328 length:162 start_codon:yes stop_codon:yes gene_type:complete